MRKPGRLFLLCVVVAAVAAIPAVAASGSGSPDATASATKSVTLKNIAFKPATVRIKRNDTVLWRWADGSIRHDVRSLGSRRFKSSRLKTSGTHRVRFSRRGTFRYDCSVHPNMKGKVVVG